MRQLRCNHHPALSCGTNRVNIHSLCIWVLSVVIIGLVVAVPANASSRVVGDLKDQKGAPIQGATIEAQNLDSGLAKLTLTDFEGRYAFDLTSPGRYKLSASSRGFNTSVKSDVIVTADQETTVDFILTVTGNDTVVVVTAPTMSKPLVVETDPRAPRQPIPAHDGADYLKTIPGFSVIRKGGTDGDPVLRGMAGSRLNVLMDGQQVLGGCGGRMDPPTAYVFPAAYQHITVMKGPQTVLYGPSASAGTILFERDRSRAERGIFVMDSSLTVGSYGRHDEMIDARAAMSKGYVQAIATRSHSDDYNDGNGDAVHSFYTRWSANAAFGWTPKDDTYLEFSLAKSDGEAAYADRMMDGSSFARENMGVRFDKRNISSVIQRVQAQWYYNYIDHAMDNYSLRTPGSMFMANNPDRLTRGGRADVTLAAGNRTTIDGGFDMQNNIHTSRNGSGMSADVATASYLSGPRLQDMRFNQYGIFGEVTRILTRSSRLIGGFRSDWQSAVDSRKTSDTRGATDSQNLNSGFGRYELDVHGGRGTFYAGVGHVERFPDYWERLKLDPVTLKSAFLTTRPENTTQFDTGILWRSGLWSGSVSGFYGKVNDYILIKWSPGPAVTRNVDATTMGGEADITYNFARNFRADATLAYVHARNDTDSKPLAQQPPLEGILGLNYDNHRFTFGGMARMVAAQDRIDVGSGNIVSNGMDIGRTAGFSVFSFNGGYRLKRALLITAGVDNVLDKAYAEHLSRAGSMVPGYVQLRHINEPGRMFWLKANFNID